MNKLIVANWKSNPLKAEAAVVLAKEIDKESVVICPPYQFIDPIRKSISKAKLGSQDVFWGDLGAYTGEISWRHVLELGVEYTIIGHSERRKYLGETDELINKKVIAAITAGLNVILCVGEPSEVRGRGLSDAKSFVGGQLDRDLAGIEKLPNAGGKLIIAYEPIWAIGTGTPDTPESASEMAKFIKDAAAKNYQLPIRVLYGGSVNGENASSFLSASNIDGALVGGASLKPEEFIRIVESSKL